MLIPSIKFFFCQSKNQSQVNNKLIIILSSVWLLIQINFQHVSSRMTFGYDVQKLIPRVNSNYILKIYLAACISLSTFLPSSSSLQLSREPHLHQSFRFITGGFSVSNIQTSDSSQVGFKSQTHFINNESTQPALYWYHISQINWVTICALRTILITGNQTTTTARWNYSQIYLHILL